MSHPNFSRRRCYSRVYRKIIPNYLIFEEAAIERQKTIRYLANIKVNGNQDVKSFDPNKSFRTPIVPAFDRSAPFPERTKSKLTQLGRDKFLGWLKTTPQIQYTDTTFRDAHQSLLATRMRTN